MVKKTEKETTGGTFWRPLGYSLLLAVFVLVMVQMTRAAYLINQVGRDNQRLVQEFKSIKDGVIQYGSDLNEIREYLLLPTKEYALFPPEKEGPAEGQPQSLGAGIDRFVSETGGTYATEKRQKQAAQDLASLLKNNDFKVKLSALKLLPARAIEDQGAISSWKFLQNKEVFAQLLLDKAKAVFTMQSILGSDLLPEGKPLAEVVLSYFEAQKDAIASMKTKIPEQKKAMQALWEDAEIGAVLSEKKCSATVNPVESEAGFEYAVENRDGETLMAIILNRRTGEFMLQDKGYPDTAALKPALMETLKGLSGESETARRIEQKKQELETYLRSPEFQGTLKNSHVELQSPRQEDKRIIYDLLNADDKTKVGSVIFETETGAVIYYRASDGVEIKEDEVLASGSKKNF